MKTAHNKRLETDLRTRSLCSLASSVQPLSLGACEMTPRFALFTVTLASSLAYAGEVGIELLEKQKNAVTSYTFDTQSSRLKTIGRASGKEISQISKYTIRSRKVVLSGNPLADAEEILYQCQVDGSDVLIVRVEHNSFSSPMKWLAALSGHPIQVSTINVLTIRDGELRNRTRLAQKDASYAWLAKVLR